MAKFGATRAQRNHARGITDNHDSQGVARRVEYRRYTHTPPQDHVEWAQTRAQYPYVPTAPISAVYQFLGVSARFNLHNGWVVGTL